MTAETQNVEWSRVARLAIEALAATGRQFTVDEVHLVIKQFTEDVPADNKAMGGACTAAAVKDIIAPLPQWLASTRVTDRALRAWVGTGIELDPLPTEEYLVAALKALDSIAGIRSQQLLEAMRRAQARKVAG